MVGTGVWLYATNQPQINTLYTCAIDDNTTRPFGLPLNEGVDQYSYILCEFHDLSSEEHSVSFNISSQGSRGRLYFDYIVYEDSSAMTISSTGPPSTLPTVTETSPRINPSFAQTGPHDTVPNVGIVVGTLFGVLCLIFGGVVAFLCIRRHRRGYKASYRRQTPLRIYTTGDLQTPVIWGMWRRRSTCEYSTHCVIVFIVRYSFFRADIQYDFSPKAHHVVPHKLPPAIGLAVPLFVRGYPAIALHSSTLRIARGFNIRPYPISRIFIFRPIRSWEAFTDFLQRTLRVTYSGIGET